jgi:hypothetical protein
MSHLADKLKMLADGSKQLTADAESAVDAALAKQQSVRARLTAAVSGITSVTADADAGTAALEEALKGLTN